MSDTATEEITPENSPEVFMYKDECRPEHQLFVFGDPSLRMSSGTEMDDESDEQYFKAIREMLLGTEGEWAPQFNAALGIPQGYFTVIVDMELDPKIWEVNPKSPPATSRLEDGSEERPVLAPIGLKTTVVAFDPEKGLDGLKEAVPEDVFQRVANALEIRENRRVWALVKKMLGNLADR